MAELIEKVNENLAQLSLGRKIALLLLLTGVIAGAVVLWLWAQTPDFRTLYANLSPEDAAAIMEKLKEERTPFKLSGGGSAILVPAQRVHELRLEMAGQGLPQGGGVGFEIFDRSNIGVTEFVQKLNYKRALQGELSRTISQLSEIMRARVHLIIPERKLFTDQQEQARASVVVVLRGGRSLSDGQVQGITHLVASSVEGLRSEAVTVIDSRGQVLSKNAGASSEIQMTRTQLELQRNIEKNLEWKIQSMLEKVVGVNKASVRVSSVLDFKQTDLTEERYDPNSQVARSEQVVQEESLGTSSAAEGGAPGVLSNIPGEPGLSTQAGSLNQSSTQRKDETINYEISKTVSRTFQPAGAVKRLSVAALVDGTYESVTGDDGNPARKYVPRSEEEMKKFEELVKTAMGYSEERGDQVVVENVPFGEEALLGDELTEAEAAPSLSDRLAPWMPLARYGFGLALGLIAFFFVIRPVMRTLLTPSAPGLPAELPAEFAQLGQQEFSKLNAPSREQIATLVRQNPQAATMVIKKWLKEKS